MKPKDKIELLKGDITKVVAEAIVNAANSSLMGGGGVDGAIHLAGGPSILEQCKKIKGGCPVGEAVITTAGNLPAKFVIHTVGPIWRGGQDHERQKLAACYRNSLRLAVNHGCKTIAFPNISTGIYGFPKEEAAKISLASVMDFLAATDEIEKLYFVCFNEENHQLIQRWLNK